MVRKISVRALVDENAASGRAVLSFQGLPRAWLKKTAASFVLVRTGRVVAGPTLPQRVHLSGLGERTRGVLPSRDGALRDRRAVADGVSTDPAVGLRGLTGERIESETRGRAGCFEGDLREDCLGGDLTEECLGDAGEAAGMGAAAVAGTPDPDTDNVGKGG
eukprot:RCo014649